MNTWEWRVSLVLGPDGPPRSEEDGGLRTEQGGTPGRPEQVRYLVGAEPGDLPLLDAPASGWRDQSETGPAARAAFEGAQAGLERGRGARDDLEARLAAAGLGGARVELVVAARARVLARAGEEALRSWELGLRYRVRSAQGARAFLWAGEEPADLPWLTDGADAWLAELVAGLRPSGRSIAALPDRGARPQTVLLRPQAAAWWVHEMAHAAFEARGEPGGPGPEGLRIVEEPAAAPWPAGFTFDDLGFPSRTQTLWDRGGVHRPSGPGHFRRASVRDNALPWPAATRLLAEGASPRGLEELPEGSPVVARVGAGRLLPDSHELLLGVEIEGVTAGGEILPARGRGVLQIGAAQAWSGVFLAGLEGPEGADLAPCTRQGCLNAVMVGAPTIGLDSVRLHLRERA